MTPRWVLGLAGALAAIAWPFAQAQDVRAIQAREARRTDERTLAYFEKFRAALTAKAGADPLLSMLVFDEQEAQALVHATIIPLCEIRRYKYNQTTKQKNNSNSLVPISPASH